MRPNGDAPRLRSGGELFDGLEEAVDAEFDVETGGGGFEVDVGGGLVEGA